MIPIVPEIISESSLKRFACHKTAKNNPGCVFNNSSRLWTAFRIFSQAFVTSQYSRRGCMLNSFLSSAELLLELLLLLEDVLYQNVLATNKQHTDTHESAIETEVFIEKENSNFCTRLHF